MAKINLTDISAGYLSLSTYNANNTLLEAAIENTLGRDGVGANAMKSNLNMDSFRITNLITAVNNSEPVTLGQANTLAGVTNPLTQTTVGTVLYPKTAAETAASVTIVNIHIEPGNVLRYGTNTNPGTTDMTATIQAAIDGGEKRIFFPSGTYKVLTPINVTSSIELYGEPGSIIDGANASFVGTNVILFKGAGLTQIAELNANVAKGVTTFTFATSITLVKDDIFIISNPTNSSWSGFRTTYKAGEYCEVVSVSTNTVKLKNPLFAAYVVADVDVYSQSSISPKLRNLEINGNVSENVIRIEFCKDAVIENIVSKHTNNAILSEVSCYHTEIINPVWDNEGDGGDDYGWVITLSQHSRMRGGDIYARRHSVAMGGGGVLGVVPVRDIKVIGSVLRNDPDSGAHNFDWHGHTEWCQAIDCTIYGGATWQGKNNGYVNCDIYSYEGDEKVTIRGAEIVGGLHYAHDCRLFNFKNPRDSLRAIVDVAGNSNAITSNTTEDCTFSIKRCHITAPNLSSSTFFMMVRNRGTDKKLNVDIDDLTMDINDLNGILLVDKISGTAVSDFILVKNIKTNLNVLDMSIGSNYKTACLNINNTERVTATNIILGSETGKTFYLHSAGGFTSTLPPVGVGLKFKFIVKTAPTTAYIIATDSGVNILQGHLLDIVGELVSITSKDTLTFVANTSLPGDYLEVESDGTSWFCTAFSRVDGGITVSA